MMPMPARDAQTLERDCRPTGEHVKDSTKQLQPVGQLNQESSLNEYANSGTGIKQEELEAHTPAGQGSYWPPRANHTTAQCR